jgi:hypothetical protein
VAGGDDVRDRDVQFHEKWLGLAQPIEGLMFSVPVLADAQIAPELSPELSAAFDAQLTNLPDAPRLRGLPSFLGDFLGYDQPGMLVPSDVLPNELAYPSEGGQEIRPSFALARGPFDFSGDDPFAAFAAPPAPADEDAAAPVVSSPYFALVWDLADAAGDALDLDRPETVTGAWRYPPTMKFERLLRHVGIPIGLLSNGESLRLIYAPAGETTAHLTFRAKDLHSRDGRPVLAALDLLLHARRAYTASARHTLEGLLAESRRRQADVTSRLASQVFEAVEILVAGFEAAAVRDATGDRLDWLRSALEIEDDHFYQGVLSVVLRLVFLLYAEDQSLLPVGHPTYAQHLSLLGLYQRLAHDDGAHPESMHHRFGAYGQLLALFRAVFFGVKHGSLELPARRGRLFDPNSYPFLEGGQPDWTAAVTSPSARAEVQPPSLDDGTVYKVMHRLMVFEGQRLSYRTLDVEQIGSVYESLMGYHVLRLTSPAVRVGKHGVWVEVDAIGAMVTSERARFLKETCGMNAGPIQSLEKALNDAADEDAVLEALSAHSVGRRGDILRHRAGAGRLVLQPGEERRRTGSHYTPRSLTEKIVRRTLEPILACLGEARTADQILQLKICDPAMGSGAFLVAACRQLADEIVQAWTRAGELAAVSQRYGDAHLHARRLVAQRCLYGVDKNAAAVELAKLSLWLVTLSRRLPFTFVDHALRHGDSLVGLDFQQIRSFHWKPSKQIAFCERVLAEALDQTLGLRQQILALAEREDPATQEEKRRLLEFSRQAVDRVRLVADVCVGAFFAKANDRDREAERLRRLGLVEGWLNGDESRRIELDEMAAAIRKKLPPFHWWIELPEVFSEERPDPLQDGAANGTALMEAVVGNPPFGGKNTINDIGGETLGDWLKVVSPGGHGNADLCAHFFRRGARLLGKHGALSLIATNTIAQGDTRVTALAALIKDGFVITFADTDLSWPGTAAVTVSVVSLVRGIATGVPRRWLDGKDVPTINSRLKPLPERDKPEPLGSNGSSFSQGTVVQGAGFIIDPAERQAIVARNSQNAGRLRPYIGGEEVNTDPRQAYDRFVIDIDDLPLERAEAEWPELIGLVRARVKPSRDQLKDNPIGLRQKKYWWRFWAARTDFYAALARLSRCLVNSQVSKHLVFAFQPTDRVFAHTLYVYPLDRFSSFAVLQSRVHEPWARLLSSSMKTDLRYSASECFETFPFPRPNPRTVLAELEEIGESLHETRAEFMRETEQGLTKTYNALKDPGCSDSRIFELRRLHEEMDRVVLATYGWSDVAVPPFCLSGEADRVAFQGFADLVIDRLFFLNAERAREEQRLGAGKPKARHNARGKKAPPGQGDLF